VMRTIVLVRYDGNVSEHKIIRRPLAWPGPKYRFSPFGIGSLVRFKKDDSKLWRVVRIGQGRGKKPLREER